MIGLVMLWMLPVLGIFVGIASFAGFGVPAGFLIPIVVAAFIFAIVKVATAGGRTGSVVPPVGVGAERQVPASEIITPTKPKALTSSDKQAELFRSLSGEAQTRHEHLIEKSQRLKQLATNVDDSETKAQLGPGLEKLQWFHLKFLLAREHLQTHTPSHLKQDLLAKLNAVRESLQAENLSDVARKSKQATLDMTEERLRNLENRQCRLTEIESDIERIESQLDLSLERAALQSSGGSTTFQLDLAERMVDSSELFGSSLPLVSDLDAHFQGSLDRPTLG